MLISRNNHHQDLFWIWIKDKAIAALNFNMIPIWVVASVHRLLLAHISWGTLLESAALISMIRKSKIIKNFKNGNPISYSLTQSLKINHKNHCQGLSNDPTVLAWLLKLKKPKLNKKSSLNQRRRVKLTKIINIPCQWALLQQLLILQEFSRTRIRGR
jgi:hypothetical protein